MDKARTKEVEQYNKKHNKNFKTWEELEKYRDEEADRRVASFFKFLGKPIQFLGIAIFYLASIAFVIAFWYIIIKFIIPGGFIITKNYLNERADRKAICAERIEDVENEFTAKKLYKACMDR